MRYLALACDYDGTLATHGTVDDTTLAALDRLRASGRKLLLITGRELDDLIRVFPQLALFDCVVAENGGVLYHPGTLGLDVLAPPPSAAFAAELRRRGVEPLSTGRTIVATEESHGDVVAQVIGDLHLALQLIRNKGALMVLPAGVDKASGLRRALERLTLSPAETVGIGDAENDEAFLAACGCGVAVANALERTKACAALVTAAGHGAGVTELIDRLIATDLQGLAPRVK